MTIIFSYELLQIHLLKYSISNIITKHQPMANHKLCLVFILCVAVSFCQFSNFVPSYLLGVPDAFITPVVVTESVDQYVKAPSFKSIFGANAAQPTNLNPVCTFPFVLFNGVCQCPRGLQFVFGKCLGATPEDYTNPTPQPNPGNPNNGTQEVTCPLHKINFISKPDYLEGLALISRTYDGSGNNKKIPSWGSANSFLQRRAPNNYVDRINKPITSLPSPRVISNTIGSQSNPIPKNRLNLTFAFTIFGQFVDHDLDITFGQAQANTSQFMNISIPNGDQFFKNQKYISFTRSQAVDEPGQTRKFKNAITSWIDGSQIYGSDNETNCALRTFKNGKLKTSGNQGEELLPLFGDFFRAGDVRAIENAVLASYHIIFVREHNRMCDVVLAANPTLNDETIFQITRNYVIGLLQKIVLKDFVPHLLGDSYKDIVGNYNGYKENVNPNIPTEFSTACFRLGHPLLVNKVPTINSYGQIQKEYALNDLFFRQEIINSQFVANVLRGSSRTITKERSPQLVDDVRNLLVLDPTNRQVKLDLFSLNIQRGRDHGLGSYNAARAAYGLPKINTFEQILSSSDIAIAKKLKNAYGTPDNIELFIGMLCEKPLKNAVLGELAARVVGQTFRNLRDGDRFWYEGAYPKSVVRQIQQTKLGDIVARNIGANDIPSDIFKFSGY